MAIVTKTINGYGPYRYRVTYSDGEHHWEYLGPVDGDGSGSDGQDVTNDDGQTGTVTPEDIEALSPAEIEELKKEWTVEELEDWKGRRKRFGLVHDRDSVNEWTKQGYRLYHPESDAYIDGETGEIHGDDADAFARRRDGDEIVYSTDGEDVARMLVWRAYLGRSSSGDAEMLEPIDESDHEPARHETMMALDESKGDRKPVNHRLADG